MGTVTQHIRAEEMEKRKNRESIPLELLLPPDNPNVARIDAIIRRLVKVSGLGHLSWEPVLLNDPGNFFPLRDFPDHNAWRAP